MSYQSAQGPGYTMTSRPITSVERKAAEDSLKPVRNNARGMAVVAIIMAVMVNFSYYEWVLIVPVFFAVMSLGLAAQARGKAKAMGKALGAGTVTEVRATPVKMTLGRGWKFGPLSMMRTGELAHQLVEGVPASVAIMPETKSLLAVNGVPLKRPVQLVVPPGTSLAGEAWSRPAPVQQASAPSSADVGLPPPPEGWTGDIFCTKCGQRNSPMAMFCQKCGTRIVR